MEHPDKHSRKRNTQNESRSPETLSKRKRTNPIEKENNIEHSESGATELVRIMSAAMFNTDEYREVNSAISEEAVNAATQINAKISGLRDVCVLFDNDSPVQVNMCARE